VYFKLPTMRIEIRTSWNRFSGQEATLPKLLGYQLTMYLRLSSELYKPHLFCFVQATHVYAGVFFHMS